MTDPAEKMVWNSLVSYHYGLAAFVAKWKDVPGGVKVFKMTMTRIRQTKRVYAGEILGFASDSDGQASNIF